MDLFGLNKENILSQIREEYDYGYLHIEAKRTKRREDLKLYVKESEENKIDIHSIYSTIQTLMSIYYLNEIQILFSKRKPGDEERAENTNIIAQFDYVEMGLEVKDYTWQMNTFLYGCGIQMNDDFDFVSIHPTIKNIDTLAYIFDPKGGPTSEDHRFFGIEDEMTLYEMKKAGYSNLEDLVSGVGQTVELNESNINNIRGEGYTEDYTSNKKYAIYIHGLIIEGQKYISVTNEGKNKLLRFIKLLPVFAEEKSDVSKIKWPVTLKYFSYLPGDSMGITPFDLLRSKQNAWSLLFNMILKMAYKNAMGGDMLVDSNKVTDISALQEPTVEGKIIPVDLQPGENLQNIITYVQRDNIGQLPLELKGLLQEESILDTGIDRNTQGVLSQGNSTLGERQMAQKNANLRFILGSKQIIWAEKFRWKYLWYRQYAANLKEAQKKEFILETGYSEDFHSFTKDEFIGEDLLHIKIKSKAEDEQEMERLKIDRIARYPQEIMEAQAEGKKGKLIMLQRNRMRDIGEPEDRVMKMYGYTVDELKAMDKYKILNFAIQKNKTLEDDVTQQGLRIDNIDEDHEVYIGYYQTLPISEIKRKAIQMRYDAIVQLEELKQEQQGQMQQQGQEQGQSGATNGAANSAASMGVASQMSQGKQLATSQDVAGG